MTIIIEHFKLDPNSVIEDYCIPDDDQIDRSLEYIESKITTTPLVNLTGDSQFENECEIAKLAINHFQSLKVIKQQTFLNLKQKIIQKITTNEFMEAMIHDQNCKKIYDLLMITFVSLLHNKKVTPKVSDWILVPTGKEPLVYSNKTSIDSSSNKNNFENLTEWESNLETTFIVVCSDLPKIIDPISSAALAIRKKQIKIISHIAEKFMRDYYPYLVSIGSNQKKNIYHEFAIKKFTKSFIDVIPDLFFKLPKILEKQEKQTICCLMEKVTDFFQDYSQSHQKMLDKDAQFDSKHIALKEMMLLESMNSLLREKSKGSYIPFPTEDDELKIRFTETIDNTLMMILGISNSEQNSLTANTKNFISTMASLLITPVLCNQVLSPYLFCLIIDQLILKDSELDMDESNAIPLKLCDSSDKEFSKNVGDLIERLSNELIGLGDAKGMIKKIPNIVSKFKFKIGSYVQKGINQVLGSDSSVKPLMILHQILYKDGSPTMIGAFNLEETEMVEFQKSIEIKVQHRLYELIMKNLPKIISQAITKFSTLEQFCKTLSHRLFEITQSPKLYIVFICYILEGIQHGLMKDNDNHQ